MKRFIFLFIFLFSCDAKDNLIIKGNIYGLKKSKLYLYDIEKNTFVDSTFVKNEAFELRDNTKSYHGKSILKAVENKKLELNQTIDKWFPTIKNSEKISVKQLLNHRSGIFNFTNSPNYLNLSTQVKTEEEMIEIIKTGGNNFSPDSRAEYSNSNYVLLTYILEKTFLKSYSELLSEYIVKPADLKNTYVFGKINTINNESKSYKFLGSWIEESETNYTIPLGAGAITSTTSDLTKFADALFGEQLLNSESLEAMKTIQEGYGYGLFQIPFYTLLNHHHK